MLQKTIATIAAATVASPITSGCTIPLPMVDATAVPDMAPSAFMTVASARARPGVRTRVATTVAIEKSGVLKQLLPKFKQASGLDVQVVAGTAAQVVDLARRGEVDLVLIDDDQPEVDKLVTQGVAGKRIPLMFNEFLLVGPQSDAAGARGKDVVAAFRKLDAARALFISRGDQSITHGVEQRYWLRAGMKSPKGGGHRECCFA